MTKESVKRERELIAQLRKSTSVREVLERAKALNWNLSEQEAREYLELITPDKPKKGYLNLLLKLVDTENSAEREVIYDKIAEHEMKRMQEEEQQPKGG